MAWSYLAIWTSQGDYDIDLKNKAVLHLAFLTSTFQVKGYGALALEYALNSSSDALLAHKKDALVVKANLAVTGNNPLQSAVFSQSKT